MNFNHITNLNNVHETAASRVQTWVATKVDLSGHTVSADPAKFTFKSLSQSQRALVIKAFSEGAIEGKVTFSAKELKQVDALLAGKVKEYKKNFFATAVKGMGGDNRIKEYEVQSKVGESIRNGQLNNYINSAAGRLNDTNAKFDKASLTKEYKKLAETAVAFAFAVIMTQSSKSGVSLTGFEGFERLKEMKNNLDSKDKIIDHKNDTRELAGLSDKANNLIGRLQELKMFLKADANTTEQGKLKEALFSEINKVAKELGLDKEAMDSLTKTLEATDQKYTQALDKNFTEGVKAREQQSKIDDKNAKESQGKGDYGALKRAGGKKFI